jgi:glutamate-ammonia-ligase adenylyltransferase
MRKKMHEGHPNPSDLFDLKHDPGGMVDIEFMVQALVLGHAHNFPELTQNLGNIALLGMAAQRDLIPQPLAEATADAYRVFRQHQHRIRLSGAASARVPSEDLASERGAVRQLWATVFQDAPSTIRPLSEIRLRTG